jgi:hypothetical protein
MELTGLFHVPGTPPPIPTDDDDLWNPEPVWVVWRNIILRVSMTTNFYTFLFYSQSKILKRKQRKNKAHH